MKEREHLKSYYERRLSLALQRVDPVQFVFDDRHFVKNSRDSPFNLTPRNREIIVANYKRLSNIGIALARITNLMSVYGRLLELLGKDFDTASKKDIEDLVSKINQKDISPVTRQDYLKKLKQLDKWLNGGEECSEKTKWIKTGLGKKHLKLPSQLVTPKEVKELLSATENVRDRALIHLLWESGARIGEVINMKMNSVEFDNGEARIRLHGKVGERQVLLLESVRDLKEYIKTRQQSEQDDPLFVLFGNRGKGEPMTHQSVNEMLKDLKKRTQIVKHIHAYLFRHSRASYLASQGLNEAQLCMIFGWTIGSKQPATYIHLSGAQVEQAYKQLYGMEKTKSEENHVNKCQVCGEINQAKTDVCQNCFNPLTVMGALKMKQENTLLQQDRDISQKVFAEAFKLMSQQKITPEEAQKEAIKIIAQQRVQETGLQTTQELEKPKELIHQKRIMD